MTPQLYAAKVVFTSTLEVPFLVPLKPPNPPKNGLVGSFSGVLKMELPVPESKIRKHFSIQIPPQNLGKMTSGMHFGHSKVVFRPFYTFCTFYTNLPIRNDKMVNFQLKFHPTKQNITKDIRPPMESSWSPLSKTAITINENIPRIGKLPYGAKRGFIERKALLKYIEILALLK